MTPIHWFSYNAPAPSSVVLTQMVRGKAGARLVWEELEIAADPDEKSWQSRGNCLGIDPDLFFPERGTSTREAKMVCAACKVREECLESALKSREKFGIWGGKSEQERRKIRRDRGLNRRAEPVCGTYSGSRAHHRRGEEPCEPCREAANAYQRIRRVGKPIRSPRSVGA